MGLTWLGVDYGIGMGFCGLDLDETSAIICAVRGLSDRLDMGS